VALCFFLPPGDISCWPVSVRIGGDGYVGGARDGKSDSLVQRGFAAEQMMVMLRETMGFVANVLQQPECESVPA